MCVPWDAHPNQDHTSGQNKQNKQKMAAVFWTLLVFIQTVAALPFPYLPASTFNVKIDDYDLLTFVPRPETFTWRPYNGAFNSTGQGFTAYVAKMSNPTYFSIKLPQEGSNYVFCVSLVMICGLQYTSIFFPSLGCGNLAKTSVTAQNNKCVYATNGGYFNVQTGDCVGNIISDGVPVQV